MEGMSEEKTEAAVTSYLGMQLRCKEALGIHELHTRF